MKVILISGHAQHGKDTTASLLEKILTASGKKVLIAHYADLLKYICKTLFNWDGQKDEVGRKLLQYVGTDVIREKRPSYWVDFIADMLDFFGDNWDYVIIPDTRFPNEVERIAEKFDSIHIRVVRENFVSPLTPEQQMHPSETALDNCDPDVLIYNDGSIQELKETIHYLISEVL